jgi:pimeloyl-ACP methyl ester carboxylesterase
MYPIFPVKLIMQDQYNSAEIAGSVTAPTLIIIAENDEVIPRESTDRLVEAFRPGVVHTAVIENATHNDIQNYTQYFMRMRDFQITGN